MSLLDDATWSIGAGYGRPIGNAEETWGIGMSFGKLAPAPKNKRKTDRRPGNVEATIVCVGGDRIRCHVKDFSNTGALLLVSSVLGVPDEFELHAGPALRRRVAVVRRGSGRIAVRFI